MRPYQIVAAERILQRIETSTNYKKTGTIAAGGYVWHTTGSGKTLTSFKAATLLSNLPSIEKVPVRRGPERPRPPDPAGVQPLPEGRGEHQHQTRTCAQLEDRRRGSLSPRSRSSPGSSARNYVDD